MGLPKWSASVDWWYLVSLSGIGELFDLFAVEQLHVLSVEAGGHFERLVSFGGDFLYDDFFDSILDSAAGVYQLGDGGYAVVSASVIGHGGKRSDSSGEAGSSDGLDDPNSFVF